MSLIKKRSQQFVDPFRYVNDYLFMVKKIENTHLKISVI